MCTLYAKVVKTEKGTELQTLEEHTKELLVRLNEELKPFYGNTLNGITQSRFPLWELLYLAALFHDAGKANDYFQERIKKAASGKREKKKNKEVPHNFLSASLVTKKLIKKLFPNKSHEERSSLLKVLFTAVAFHHDRSLPSEKDFIESFNSSFLKRKNELLSCLKKLQGLIPFQVPFEELEIYPADKTYWKIRAKEPLIKSKYSKLQREIDEPSLLILTKGLLHRLDHSASAAVPVELQPHGNRAEKLKERFKLKSFQEEGLKNANRSVMLEAPTGSGKTEFATCWLADSKGFYTLPLKTAVNAMHGRLKGLFGTVGLLHGDRSLYYLNEEAAEEESLGTALFNLDAAAQLAYPLTVSTADQLFISVFKYPGFEKVYATLAYSKVIIDEPQAYSPLSLAAIVKGIKELSELGCKFCVMSATLPPVLEEHLKELEFHKVDTKKLYDESSKKHKVKVVESFEEGLELFKKRIESGKARNGLIIVNTVKRAQELFKKLKENPLEGVKVKLLHSLFTLQDRKELEKEINQDSESRNRCVWITTQVAEASLDVDFDLLLTEAASADALVQRLGRVFRKRGNAEPAEVNAIITKESSDKGKIYPTKLVEESMRRFEEVDGRLLTENYKRETIKELFSERKLKEVHKNYLDSFNQYLNLLNLGLQAASKREAQKLFRDILAVPAVPEPVFEENREEIEALMALSRQRDARREEKLRALAKLNSFTVNLKLYHFKRNKELMEFGRLLIAQIDYDKEIGVNILKVTEDEVFKKYERVFI